VCVSGDACARHTTAPSAPDLCFLLLQGIPKEKIPGVRVSGDIVLGTFGFQPGAFWGDVARLVMLLTVFLAATFLLLKYRRQP